MKFASHCCCGRSECPNKAPGYLCSQPGWGLFIYNCPQFFLNGFSLQRKSVAQPRPDGPWIKWPSTTKTSGASDAEKTMKRPRHKVLPDAHSCALPRNPSPAQGMGLVVPVTRSEVASDTPYLFLFLLLLQFLINEQTKNNNNKKRQGKRLFPHLGKAERGCLSPSRRPHTELCLVLDSLPSAKDRQTDRQAATAKARPGTGLGAGLV